tara:strand:- start:67 stop:417 length:351 start_codon:yes stop_codon:yes gene_type:complete
MSKENLEQFLEKVGSDEELRASIENQLDSNGVMMTKLRMLVVLESLPFHLLLAEEPDPVSVQGQSGSDQRGLTQDRGSGQVAVTGNVHIPWLAQKYAYRDGALMNSCQERFLRRQA